MSKDIKFGDYSDEIYAELERIHDQAFPYLELKNSEELLKLLRTYSSEHIPEEYLRKRIELIPDLIKWYMNVFQSIIIAGMIALEITLLNASFNLLTKDVEIINFFWNISYSNHSIGCILLIISIIYPTIVLIFPKNVSDFIQWRFRIRKNQYDLSVELWWITKYLEKKKEHQNKDN